MTRRRLPPMCALIAFEATARLGSVTQAADELAVTQSAVSHQLRQLEEMLGFALFNREGGRMVLTAAGRAYLPVLTHAFDQIADGTRRVTRSVATGLTLGAMIGSLYKAMIPNLGALRQRHPDLVLDIRRINHDDEFEALGLDAALIIAPQETPLPAGCAARHYCHDVAYVVAAPQWLAARGVAAGALRGDEFTAADLLLDFDDHIWTDWFATLPLRPAIDLSGAMRFSHTLMSQEAAALGHGLTIGRQPMLRVDQQAGRLVPLSPAFRDPSWRYRLIWRESLSGDPRIAAVADWLEGVLVG